MAPADGSATSAPSRSGSDPDRVSRVGWVDLLIDMASIDVIMIWTAVLSITIDRYVIIMKAGRYRYE